MAIRLTPEEFPPEIRRRFRSLPGVIQRGIRAGTKEGERILAVRTPRATGTTAARWRVRGNRQTGYSIHNAAPHVGILDLGARPHPVNKAGIRALTRWAQLVLGLDAEAAKRAAFAIANKIRKQGAKPTYFVRDSMDDLKEAVRRNVSRRIDAQAKRKAKETK